MSTNADPLWAGIVTPEDRGLIADDRVLLCRWIDSRSHQAFAELVGRYHRVVYWVCRRVLRDGHLADDAAQTVFMTLARKAAILPPDIGLRGWLCQTARHMSLDLRKQEKRRRRRHEDAGQISLQRNACSSSPDEDLRLTVAEIISKLPAQDRNAISQRYLDGMSIAQIAAAQGLSRDGAKKRVARALDRMRLQFAGKKWLLAILGAALGASLRGSVARAGAQTLLLKAGRAAAAVAWALSRSVAIRVATSSAVVAVAAISAEKIHSSGGWHATSGMGRGSPITQPLVVGPMAPANVPSGIIAAGTVRGATPAIALPVAYSSGLPGIKSPVAAIVPARQVMIASAADERVSAARPMPVESRLLAQERNVSPPTNLAVVHSKVIQVKSPALAGDSSSASAPNPVSAPPGAALPAEPDDSRRKMAMNPIGPPPSDAPVFGIIGFGDGFFRAPPGMATFAPCASLGIGWADEQGEMLTTGHAGPPTDARFVTIHGFGAGTRLPLDPDHFGSFGVLAISGGFAGATLAQCALPGDFPSLHSLVERGDSPMAMMGLPPDDLFPRLDISVAADSLIRPMAELDPSAQNSFETNVPEPASPAALLTAAACYLLRRPSRKSRH